MAQLNDLIVTGSSRFLNDINGNTTSADQVNNDLTIQLNGGTTEGTNKFTFNGSTAKSLNITASSIGAGTGTVTSVKVGTTSYSPSSGVVSLPAYPTTLPASDTTSTYSASGTVPVNGTAVASALGTLDGTVSGSAGASKTLTAFSQTDGKVSATFGNISITKSQVSDFPTSMTPTSHTHGNIQNGGTLQTNDITIASGDKLVVTDSSDSSKVARTSISFDGSTATKALTQKGTWETFGTSNLTIGTTSSTAMAGNTNVNNVTQTETTTNAYYEVLLSNSDDDTTETAGVNKNSKLTYNPYDGVLYMFDQGKSITMAPGNIDVGQAGNSTVSITQSEISINSYPGNSISLSATGLIGDVTGNVTGNLNGNVKQSATSTSTNNNYPILFSGSTSTSSGQYGINRQAKLTYNPSTNVINLNNDGYIHLRTGSDDSSGYTDIGSGGIGAINSDNTGITLSRGDNNGDITLIGTNNTWDGVNTSLKTAISGLHGYAQLWINSGNATASSWTVYTASNGGVGNSDLFTFSSSGNKSITVKKTGVYLVIITQKYTSIPTGFLCEFGLWDATGGGLANNCYSAASLVAYEQGIHANVATLTANHVYKLAGNTKGKSVTFSLAACHIIPLWLTT